MINLKEVEEFFLEAARQTYAADAPKTTIAELPKSKVYRYEHEDWLYVDLYFATNCTSFGTTTIWYRGQPIWGMQYHGYWNMGDERIIPFLKLALRVSYENGVFYGGRGPNALKDESGNLTYRNWPEPKSFVRFEGYEEIYDERIKELFHHDYSGMALI